MSSTRVLAADSASHSPTKMPSVHCLARPPDTDTVQGRFVELIPSETIVQIVEFESQQPEFAGEMTITAAYTDTPGGTEVTMLCENIPKGIRPEDNEMGCRESLQKLAALLE
jgi:uncharacterized protein YndB with AHSA1/START domain